MTNETALASARAEQSSAIRTQTPREVAGEFSQMRQQANNLSSSASLHYLAHDAAQLSGVGGSEALQQAQLDTPRADPANLQRDLSQAQDEADALLRG